MTDATTRTTSATVAAAKVRAGNWLLVDGYVREVVRVETVAASAASTGRSDSGDAGSAEILLRVCFLNGSNRVVPHNHAFEVTRHADTVGAGEQPDRPSNRRSGRPSDVQRST